jgi:hypothetical protein
MSAGLDFSAKFRTLAAVGGFVGMRGTAAGVAGAGQISKHSSQT